MSYILEGLKKLEQRRRQETRLPGLLTFREDHTRRSKKPIFWPYLLFIALLLNAGIIAWWMSPWRIGGRAGSNPKISGQKVKPFSSKPVEFKNQNMMIPEKETQAAKATKEIPKTPTPEKAKESSPPLVKDSPAPKRSLETVPALTESQPSNLKAAPDGRVLKLSELPSEIKKNLPALKISLHYFNPDHQSRFVTINDRTLHEGEILGDGLRVVEINQEDTIFYYKGHRFRIGLNENP